MTSLLSFIDKRGLATKAGIGTQMRPHFMAKPLNTRKLPGQLEDVLKSARAM